MGTLGLGPVGVALNVSGSYLAEAAEAERLGYSAIWLPGGQLDDLARLADLAQATDPARARESAGRPLRFLAGLPGYQASFARMGLDAAETGRLADELICWGDAGTVSARIGQLHEAGADHVILHVLHEGGQPGPIEAARALAGR